MRRGGGWGVGRMGVRLGPSSPVGRILGKCASGNGEVGFRKMRRAFIILA
jgi:hypothetical protein